MIRHLVADGANILRDKCVVEIFLKSCVKLFCLFADLIVRDLLCGTYNEDGNTDRKNGKSSRGHKIGGHSARVCEKYDHKETDGDAGSRNNDRCGAEILSEILFVAIVIHKRTFCNNYKVF